MVTKKKSVTKKNSKNTLKLNKNILAVVLGSISIPGAFLLPSIIGLIALACGIIGLILAYNNKKEISNKLNKWGFYLSLSGLIFSLMLMMLNLIYLFSMIQSAQ